MTGEGCIMKITDFKDPSTQIIQSYQRSDNQNQPVDKQAAPAAAASETVDISSRAKDIQLAQTVISNLPDIRDARVQELKTRIEQGNYKINTGEIAKQMISESLIDIFS
jgi:negative regulator of flagellin synthesis FlgM